jgi:hypothetical protein
VICDESEERSDSRQTAIARTDRRVPLKLDMLQKRKKLVRCEVTEF